MLPLASIPSPSSGNLGPFHMYGVLLAVGVLVATYIGEHRWRNRGYPKDGIYDIAFWVVIAGVIGARLYHVITDYELFEHDLFKAVEIWKGGLGIWGAVIGGGLAVVVVTRRRHMDTLAVTDCMAPGIVLAQAIGRWGNWFNQELFGKPTTLPWGLEISPAHRPFGYAQFTTFQPTFLYESLWCLAIFGALLLRGAALPVAPGPDVRAVRRALHIRPLLVREPADRPGARDRAVPGERVDEPARLHRRDRLVRLARRPRSPPAPPGARGACGRCRSLRGFPRQELSQ